MKRKQIISGLLSAAMLLSAVSFPVFAEREKAVWIVESAAGSEEEESQAPASELEPADLPAESPQETEPPEAAAEPSAEPSETEDTEVSEIEEELEAPEAAGAVIEPDSAALSEEEEPLSVNEYNQASVEQYGGMEALKDPQIIPDAEFFGEWDAKAEEWVQRPYLDYALDPILQRAELAAKRADYDRAKEFILEYYRKVFGTHTRDLDAISLKDRRGQISAQAAFENLIYVKNGNAIAVDRFDLTAADQRFKTDVSEDVAAVRSGTNKVSYLITGLKKDGYQGVFYSKEASDPAVRPYLRVNINGSPVNIYPDQDTYISAGSNKSKSYGNLDVLRAEESKSSYGSKASVDSNTKKSYLTFDLSGYLQDGDVLGSAELYLTGHMEPGDGCGGDYDQTQAEASVIVWKDPQINWKEADATWNNYPEQIVFSYAGMYGPPFDTSVSGANKVEASYRDNISKYSSYVYLLARAYIYNQDDAYAYHAIRLLLNAMKEQSKHDPSNPRDQSDIFLAVNGNFHNTGQRAKFSPEIINAIIDSKAMTPEAFSAILKNSYLICDALAQHWGSQQEGNNHGSLQIEGLSRLMLCFREFYQYSAPLLNGGKPTDSKYPSSFKGGWYEVAKARIQTKIGQDMFSDGASIEVGLGYVSLNMECYANLIDAVRQTGLPTDALIGEKEFKAMEEFCRYMINVSTPTMGDWQQGHGYGHGANYRSRVQMIQNYTTDPLLLWAASNGADGQTPGYQSVVYDVGRKAVLRNVWDSNAVAMQINADAGRQSHGQHDDLGLNFYAYGQHFLVDPLYFDYTTSRPENIYLNSTRAHNAIEINGISQKGGQGGNGEAIKSGSGIRINNPGNGGSDALMGNMHPENRELNPMYDFIRTETNAYKNGIAGGSPFDGSFAEYRDLLYIKPGYTIVTDYIKPDNTKENTYAQNWHFHYQTHPSLDAENHIIRSNNNGPNLILAAVKQQEDFINLEQERPGLYSPGAPTVIDSSYWAFEKKASGAVSFNTVLLPMEAGEDKTVRTENLTLDVAEDVANAFHLYVTDEVTGENSVGTYYTVLGDDTAAAANQTLRQFGGYATDGRLAFAEKKDDTFSTAILRSGTTLTDESVKTASKAVILSGDRLEELGVTWSGGYMSIHSSKIKTVSELGNLAIYNGGETIKKLRLNGEDITKSIQQTANYIYFGARPDDENAKPDDSGQSGNTNGSGHGGGGLAGGGGQSGTIVPGGDPQTTAPPDSDLPFEAELKGHWGEKEIRELIEKGIVKGLDETTLGLERAVTRAEFVTMLVRAFNLEGEAYQAEFGDVSPADWYADSLAAAKKNGILTGDENGNANPNSVITREEMAKIAVSALERVAGISAPEGNGTAFPDQGEISGWAQPYVEAAAAFGLIIGMEDGSFQPKGDVLREQAMIVIYRLLIQNK